MQVYQPGPRWRRLPRNLEALAALTTSEGGQARLTSPSGLGATGGAGQGALPGDGGGLHVLWSLGAGRLWTREGGGDDLSHRRLPGSRRPVMSDDREGESSDVRSPGGAADSGWQYKRSDRSRRNGPLRRRFRDLRRRVLSPLVPLMVPPVAARARLDVACQGGQQRAARGAPRGWRWLRGGPLARADGRGRTGLRGGEHGHPRVHVRGRGARQHHAGTARLPHAPRILKPLRRAGAQVDARDAQRGWCGRHHAGRATRPDPSREPRCGLPGQGLRAPHRPRSASPLPAPRA